MQITPDQLLAEAGAMALEIRLKDQALAALQAENKTLREQTAGASDSHEHGREDDDGHS